MVDAQIFIMLWENSLLNKNLLSGLSHKFILNQLPITDFYHPNDIFYEDRMRAFARNI